MSRTDVEVSAPIELLNLGFGSPADLVVALYIPHTVTVTSQNKIDLNNEAVAAFGLSKGKGS